MLGRLFSTGRFASPKALQFAFATSEEFFNHQCVHGDVALIVGKPIVGRVVDGRLRFGAEKAVVIQNDGIQRAVLTIASEDGGFDVYAATAKMGEVLLPGDLVAWTPVDVSGSPLFEDPRSAWIGFIIAKLAPYYYGNGPAVIARYS